jgi:hypothetical protein
LASGDVERQPLPDRQAFGRAAQNARVAVRVDEAGHQQPIGQVLHGDCRVIAPQFGEPADRRDAVAADEHSAVRDDAVSRVHRQHKIGSQNLFVIRHGSQPHSAALPHRFPE